MKISSLSPAKAILFGEHFVVYGATGIAAAITPYNEMEVELEKTGKPCLEYISTKKESLKKDAKDCREGSAHPIEALYAHLLKKIPVLEKYKVKAKVKKCWKLKGVGNSASLCAAFAYAIITLFKEEKVLEKTAGAFLQNREGVGAKQAFLQNMKQGVIVGAKEIFIEKAKKAIFGEGKEKKILFEYVQVGEEAAHGKGRASGIDASASVYGGVFSYEKSFAGKAPKIKTANAKMKKGYRFLLINTSAKGKKANTAAQIEKFAKKCKIEKKPAEMNAGERGKICKEYNDIAKEALGALRKGNMQMLGKCMRKNHKMLRERDVSSPSIEKAIKICEKEGALGAKMTGAGGEGGAVIALAKEKDIKKIKNALLREKFETYEFEFSKKGVCKK